MSKMDYKKMKDNDFAKSKAPVYSMRQEAKISYTENGAVKVSFRGDQPSKVAISAILKALDQCRYNLIGNPVLYFYPVGNDAPAKKPKSSDSWEPRPTMGQSAKNMPEDDGTLPWNN